MHMWRLCIGHCILMSSANVLFALDRKKLYARRSANLSQYLLQINPSHKLSPLVTYYRYCILWLWHAWPASIASKTCQVVSEFKKKKFSQLLKLSRQARALRDLLGLNWQVRKDLSSLKFFDDLLQLSEGSICVKSKWSSGDSLTQL